MSRCHQLPQHATAGESQVAISIPQLLLPNRESGGESGPGCTPPSLYKKIPSYLRLAPHVINKATLLSLRPSALEKRKKKSFCGLFVGVCSSRDNQKLKQQALQLFEMDDIQVVESKPLLVDRELPGLREAIQQLVIKEHDVETPHGRIHCTMKGVPKADRPVILTIHDIGLNHKTCWDSLFNHEDMSEIMQHFAVCHVDAPGQQEGANTFSTGYEYPSMDQLSETLPLVLKHFGLKTVIGMGIGAGAYILTRFALDYPNMVEGLLLININPCAEGWMDWAAHKISGWTHAMPDMIITHLFGKEEIHNNHDLIGTYRHHILNDMNQFNLHLFVKSYESRRDLEIERPVPGTTVRTLKCPSLLVVGDSSPAVEAVVECNTKLDPTKTTLLKMADCGGMPQVDQPGKLTEAFKYFIQGMGYMPSASMTRLVRSRTASGSSVTSFEGNRSRSHTTEGNRSRSHTNEGSRSRSHTAENQRGRSHTAGSTDGTANSNVDQAVPKSTEVSC
uniref:N-myc downstream regulated 1a n=2 Tax=Dicentrarchus labrax TaxID=13489 RepID=A0A8C4I191_DICLA